MFIYSILSKLEKLEMKNRRVKLDLSWFEYCDLIAMCLGYLSKNRDHEDFLQFSDFYREKILKSWNNRMRKSTITGGKINAKRITAENVVKHETK